MSHTSHVILPYYEDSFPLRAGRTIQVAWKDHGEGMSTQMCSTTYGHAHRLKH